MKEFKFNFLNGFYLVSVKDNDETETEFSKIDDLQTLVNAQTVLRSVLPYREPEIDSFILSCVNDVVNGVRPKK